MEDLMSFTPLGSGQEVGRSCHVLEFRGLTILLDIGIHPGFEGLNGLPFLDQIEPSDIDVLLVTHFHLDHAASLPFLTERTTFKGRIFMTHPTQSVLRLLLGDYLRLLQMNQSEDVLYNEAELARCLEKIELIDYHQSVTVGPLQFHATNAGHVLGACMYWIELGGRSILYTGDYSMEHDRHLAAAEIPERSPDVLIVESTYGVQAHTSRPEREARFTGTVERVVTRGGRCLIPVFALGRAQELLLILDEYWQANAHLQNIPIYYASKLASRALRVYQTYANMMNARIRAQMDVANPFRFQFIQNLKSINKASHFDDSGPAVVFASPGMLQSGVSRQLFDRWAADPKNGVLIAGYAVEHTLAKEIMAQPKEVVTLEGRRQPLNCLVDYVSFSAHVDFVQNRAFITQVAPTHIILVHGQKDEMGRLKSALLHQYKQFPENKRPTITMPPNLQAVTLKFARRRSAKVLGSLANQVPEEGEGVQGILVTRNFASKLVAPDDLATYTPLRVGSVSSTLHVPFVQKEETPNDQDNDSILEVFLREMFANVGKEVDNDGVTRFYLHGGKVSVATGIQTGMATVEWEASPAGDVVADSVVALLMHAQSSAASIRLTGRPCRHPNDTAEDGSEDSPSKRQRVDLVASRLKFLQGVLKDQFESVEAVFEGTKATFEVRVAQSEGNVVTEQEKSEDANDETAAAQGCVVSVEFVDEAANNAKISVESTNEKLGENITECLRRAVDVATPVVS